MRKYHFILNKITIKTFERKKAGKFLKENEDIKELL